jgi:hypothetical protein
MPSAPPSLSIIVTVVSGPQSLRRCLTALAPQVAAPAEEVIVPYDVWCRDVGELAHEFPAVQFLHVVDLGIAADPAVRAHAHRLYDRRRAMGLRAARGQVIAMTEDHAVPASDWCAQIRAAHQQPYAVIGGAVENGVDRPMNWALYYCDFGRYGRPFAPGPADYVSDVNVSYKRPALEAVADRWCDAYHETSLHWALRARGEVLFRDPRPVVYQHRPPLRLAQAYRERIDWGRVFAETRAATGGAWRALTYAAGTPVLPLVLLARMLRHMRRQRRSAAQIARTAPLAFVLLTGWALGELLGYVGQPPRDDARGAGKAERKW